MRLTPIAATLAGTLLLSAGHTVAQDTVAPPPAVLPDGWLVRPDAAHMRHDGLTFSEMEPGWHVTTGPSVILYDPARTASGEFRVSSEIFLFDPGDRREGFGIFVGGSDLDAAAQSYVYFLIRRDGRFLVKRRVGEATEVLHDWTAHEAIVSWEGRGEGATARNVLAVNAGEDEVVFLINDQEVARMPREGTNVDGMVGLRVNHSINIHVSSLDVSAS